MSGRYNSWWPGAAAPTDMRHSCPTNRDTPALLQAPLPPFLRSLPPLWQSHVGQLWRMWLMMLKQAVGVPDGAHGAFTVNGMDAVTIRSVYQPGQARQLVLLHDIVAWHVLWRQAVSRIAHCCALLAMYLVLQPEQVLQHALPAAGGWLGLAVGSVCYLRGLTGLRLHAHAAALPTASTPPLCIWCRRGLATQSFWPVGGGCSSGICTGEAGCSIASAMLTSFRSQEWQPWCLLSLVAQFSYLSCFPGVHIMRGTCSGHPTQWRVHCRCVYHCLQG